MAAMPGRFGEAGSKAKDFNRAIDDTASKGPGFLSFLGNIPIPAVIAATAVAGVGAVAVDMGMKMQDAADTISAAEGISDDAARNITANFAQLSGVAIYSATDIGSAFGSIAGQAEAVNKGALSAKTSLQLMTNAVNLAEASGSDLTSSTKQLVGVLQAFQLPMKDATSVTNALYVASNTTGQSIEKVAGGLEKTKSRLGGVAPSFQQMSALLVDMTEHGETGRQALTALGSSFQALLKPETAIYKAQREFQITLGDLPPSLKKLASAYTVGKESATYFTNATANLGVAQGALWTSFTKAADAMRGVNDTQKTLGINALTTSGQLAPMVSIISQLHDKLKGLGPAAAAAKLSAMGFGSAAGRLVGVIQAGPAAYEKYVKAVEKHNAAQDAATRRTSGFHDQIKKLASAIDNAFSLLGLKMMPVIDKAVAWIIRFIQTIVKHRAQIGSVLGEIGRMFGLVFHAIGEVIKGAYDVISGLIKFITDVFKGHWRSAWHDVKQIFTGEWEEIKGYFDLVLAHFGTSVDDIIKKVVGTFTAMPGDVMGAVAGFGAKINHWIESVEHILLNAVEHGVVDVVRFYAQLPARVLNAVATLGSLIWNWMTSAMTFLLNAEINGLDNAVSYFVGLPGRILNAVAGIGSWLFNAGIHLIEGLIHGMVNTAQKAVDTVGHIASDVVHKALSIFGIGSPSKVFHDIGGHIVEGLALGISDNASRAHSALNDMMSGMIGSGGVAGANLAISGAGAGGGSPIILQVTTPIQLNGTTLAQAVTQYQLRQARSTGNTLGRYAGGSQTAAATGTSTNAISR